VNGDAVDVVPATGGNYVSILHGQCSADGRQRALGGRLDRARGQEAWREEGHKEIIPEVKSKGGNMGQVTNEQANLMLRLYEDRREPKLREARDWFSANFHVKTQDDLMRVCPPGSQGNLYMRMVLGYWEMVASIVNRGLIDEEFFFESNGEQWAVWEQVKPVIGVWRAMFSSPNFLSNLEEQSKRLEAWREKRSPGSNEAIRKVLAQMQSATQTAKAQAAAS
jgi:hypothetical protein